jgi:HTH-like domain
LPGNSNDLELVIRIGRDHESPPSQGQQFVFPHHLQNPFVIHLHSSIQQIALEHRRRYGYRRICAELRRAALQ